MDYYRQIGWEEEEKGKMGKEIDGREEKNRTEEKERTEEMRIGNDCLGRDEIGRDEEIDWERKRGEYSIR